MQRAQRHRQRSIAWLAVFAVGAFTLAAVGQLPGHEEGHRPLRSHPQSEPPDPQPTASFTGYPEAPEFTTVARIEKLSHFPCSTCHGAMQPNPERRKLMAPHPAALEHGDGRFWCLDCHAADDRDKLATLADERVSFDRADRVCAQCHSDVHRDWVFGVHGKRARNWQGPREYYSCAHCHDPHDPALRPRPPADPPRVRAGLEPMPEAEHHQPLYGWLEQQQETDSERQDQR